MIRVWDLVTEREGPTLRGHLDGVNSLTFCPDGRTLISGSADHTMKLWRVDRGELLTTLTEHKGSVHAVVLTPDGGTLISAGAGLPGEHFGPNPGQMIVWRKQKEP